MTNLSDLCTMVAQCKVAIFLNGPEKARCIFSFSITQLVHTRRPSRHTRARGALTCRCVQMFALALSTNGLSPFGCKLIKDPRCPWVDQQCNYSILLLKCSYKSNPEAGSPELSRCTRLLGHQTRATMDG